SNSVSDSGSCQPAMRTAMKATPAISTAASRTPSAMSSSALTAPIELKPCPTTSTTRPSDSATRAASPVRRKGLKEGGWREERMAGLLYACLLQRTRDHDALDLVRALVDLRDLGVPHHALHRV